MDQTVTIIMSHTRLCILEIFKKLVIRFEIYTESRKCKRRIEPTIG